MGEESSPQEAILQQKATGFKFEQCIKVQGLFTKACFNTLVIVAARNYDVLTHNINQSCSTPLGEIN